MKVSVAVITYNMEGYLSQLLDSILRQKVNFEYEIVIDDDHSPDNSRALIHEYHKRYPGIVHPIFRDTNVGGSKNMFGVLNACKGKYIAILEGDDWWENDNKLQYQYDFMEAHSDTYIGMCCNSWCDHGIEAEYAQKMRDRTTPKVFTYKDFMARHFKDRLPSSTDTWFFKNFLHDGGDYSLFYEAHNMIWDQSLDLMMLGKGNIYADPTVMSHHRSVTSKTGKNYQSLITRKNMLYGDSKMYLAMEKYMEEELRRPCEAFYLVRGDVWVEAVFRAMLSHKKEDWHVAKQIWKDQRRKCMLCRLFLAKTWDILMRKFQKVFLGK